MTELAEMDEGTQGEQEEALKKAVSILGETGKDNLVWDIKQKSEADRLAKQFDDLGEAGIEQAVEAAQGTGNCPDELTNYGDLDPEAKKAALDSLLPSTKARLLPAAQAEDCEHFRLAVQQVCNKKDLMRSTVELKLMRNRLLMSYRRRWGICKRW